jgi:lipopolysaccharide transport system ATP-binding protein
MTAVTSGRGAPPAVSVDGLGKRYRLGSMDAGYRTLRDSISGIVSSGRRRERRERREAGELWALDDVSFSVEQGQVVGVIGRNGAGKSTLLKVLSRITEPTTGVVDIYGRVGSLLEVGTGFHPELTGRENIYLNGAILGMPKRQIASRFAEIVGFAEVARFIETPVKRYSTGMYLRLAFSVAAHMDTDVLLVDEVLAVGDLSFQQKCLGKMSEVAEGGRTVLFVSHNMSAISALTSRCLLLDSGRIVEDGPTRAVIGTYMTSGASQAGRVEWAEPPGNDWFRLESCQVGDGVRTEFSGSEAITIRLTFSTDRTANGLRVGFDLLTAEGVVVCRSYHDDEVLDPPPVMPGHYEVEATIPPALLNQGQYYVSPRAGVHGVERLCEVDRAVRFSLLNLEGRNSQYGGERPGVVNPPISWLVKER